MPAPGPPGRICFEKLLDLLENPPRNDCFMLAGKPPLFIVGLTKVGAVLQKVGEGPICEGNSAEGLAGDLPFLGEDTFSLSSSTNF